VVVRARWVAKPSGGNHNSGVAAFIYPPDPIFKSIGERHVNKKSGSHFIAEDPCKVPGALSTAGFICPGCTDSWDVTQKLDIEKVNKEQNLESGISLENLLSLSKIHLWPVEQKPENLESLPLVSALFN
jgi:hypothetical protein